MKKLLILGSLALIGVACCKNDDDNNTTSLTRGKKRLYCLKSTS